MGKSITFMTEYSALQGGKINIRIGNYILTKIMAGRYTMDLDAYEPKKGSPEETQKDKMYDDIRKLAMKDCYIYNEWNKSKWSKILDGNVDVVAFATDKAETRTNMEKCKVTFNFKGQLCIISLNYTKGNLVRLTIFSPFFKQFPSKGRYATREEMEVMLHTYDKKNKDYGSASKAINLGGKFMDKITEQAGNLIKANESVIKKVKEGNITTKKQMYACCPYQLKELVQEGLRNGYIKYEIDKDREIVSGDGKTVKYDGNIMIFYPTKTAMNNFFGFILVDNMNTIKRYINSPLVYLGKINKEQKWLKDAQVEDIEKYYEG